MQLTPRAMAAACLASCGLLLTATPSAAGNQPCKFCTLEDACRRGDETHLVRQAKTSAGVYWANKMGWFNADVLVKDGHVKGTLMNAYRQPGQLVIYDLSINGVAKYMYLANNEKCDFSLSGTVLEHISAWTDN